MIPAIRVRPLHKRYDGIAALTDVGPTVRHGEVMGLIGPNGAGKTTLRAKTDSTSYFKDYVIVPR